MEEAQLVLGADGESSAAALAEGVVAVQDVIR
jgi:hypothetical protein